MAHFLSIYYLSTKLTEEYYTAIWNDYINFTSIQIKNGRTTCILLSVWNIQNHSRLSYNQM